MLYRLMDMGGDAAGKKYLWPKEYVTILCETVGKAFGLDPLEIFDHLLDPALQRNAMIVELIRGRILRLNASNIAGINRDMMHFVHGSRRIVSLGSDLPMHLSTDEVIAARVKAQTEDLQIDQDLAERRIECGKVRRDEFESNYKPGLSNSIVAVFDSGMEEFQSCQGRYRYLDPDDAFDCMRIFAAVAVKDLHLQYRRIRQEALPADLARWARSIKRAMVIDDKVLVKVCRCGDWTKLERTNSPSQNSLFEGELARLYAVVNSVQVADSQTLLRSLAKEAEEIERRKLEERFRDLEDLRRKNPQVKRFKRSAVPRLYFE
jgi:hypothetical protein